MIITRLGVSLVLGFSLNLYLGKQRNFDKTTSMLSWHWIFVVLSIVNLNSIICFSYPSTRTLSFNLRVAFSFWVISFVFLINKKNSLSSFLPKGAPWFLACFLSIIELIRRLIRPVTLCFRLLANIRAGHILLSLICKINYGLWILGIPFGALELIIAMVQSFVLFMLLQVYFEEAISH